MSETKIFPGADEPTPSRAQFFTWINNTNEGATEAQTLANFEFFQWLHDKYGMELDIYAFDAGAIDGKRFYGKINSERFKKQFPNGFGKLAEKAAGFGARLGVWGGPDGFGDTEEEAEERIAQMVSLCKDYHFALFKFDSVCGALRHEKEDFFVEMMKECRRYSPDLILLNHRLGLKKGLPYATTQLWGGEETYVDVFSFNKCTAPHHRAGALSRGLTPDMKRLTEDHGVCISSCIDGWDDDLVLQAFNRCLLLAPEVYGNPWLMKDEEFPKFARIFNLHRKFRDVMPNADILPEAQYGKFAVSRGNGSRRLVTLRNLTWKKQTVEIRIADLHLDLSENIEVRTFHQLEKFLGSFDADGTFSIEIEPFRAALIYAGTPLPDEPAVVGTDFQVIRSVGKTVEIDLLFEPGKRAEFALRNPENYSSAIFDGENSAGLLNGKPVQYLAPGEPVCEDEINCRIRPFEMIPNIPPELDNWAYEAAVFEADSNALEVRSLMRAGDTVYPAVKKAREAFLGQDVFRSRGLWDRYLFDGDPATAFWKSRRFGSDQSVDGGCFRLDLGGLTDVDTITIDCGDEYSLEPLLREEAIFAKVSTDLKRWKEIAFLAGARMVIPVHSKIRFLKLLFSPDRIVSVSGEKNGTALDRSGWRASNLFAQNKRIHRLWHSYLVPKRIIENSYLTIALEGVHGIEGAYVALTVDGEARGCPDRAPSYQSNIWEFINRKSDSNYSYYFPLTKDMAGKTIEIFVLGCDCEHLDFQPEAYLCCPPGAHKERKRLKLTRK